MYPNHARSQQSFTVLVGNAMLLLGVLDNNRIVEPSRGRWESTFNLYSRGCIVILPQRWSSRSTAQRMRWTFEML